MSSALFGGPPDVPYTRTDAPEWSDAKAKYIFASFFEEMHMSRLRRKRGRHSASTRSLAWGHLTGRYVDA